MHAYILPNNTRGGQEQAQLLFLEHVRPNCNRSSSKLPRRLNSSWAWKLQFRAHVSNWPQREPITSSPHMLYLTRQSTKQHEFWWFGVLTIHKYHSGSMRKNGVKGANGWWNLTFPLFIPLLKSSKKGAKNRPPPNLVLTSIAVLWHTSCCMNPKILAVSWG